MTSRVAAVALGYVGGMLATSYEAWPIAVFFGIMILVLVIFGSLNDMAARDRPGGGDA